MATHNKTLQLIASKLGLADEDKVLRKAAEFERLLQTKTTAGSNMTDTSKIVICLDLASFLLGVDLDTKTAIKYSGLRPPMYTSSRKMVENLLELNSDKMTVAGVCVKLQCTGVQDSAQDILEEYRKQAKIDIDLNLPQYVCMAVHQACRLNKVKVSKSKLVETSRLRPAQWAKLEADWAKFADKHFAGVKKRRDRSVKTAVVNDDVEIDKPAKEELPIEPQSEPYDDWKKRMLETAYKELEGSEKRQMKKQKIEKVEEERRSPRKNTQNLSPGKNSQQSHRKSQVNRLLSPMKDPSPTHVSHHLTFGKLREGLSLRKESQVSPRTQVSQHLSSRKPSEGLSPRKENPLSPREDMFLSPNQEDTPRRSPRKTPQKFSPYNSPVGKNGVRLLFPKNMF